MKTVSYLVVASSEVSVSGVPGCVEEVRSSPCPAPAAVEAPPSGIAISCCFSRSSYNLKRSKSCRSANLLFLGFFTWAGGTHGIRDFTQFEQGVWRSHLTLRCEQSTQGRTFMLGLLEGAEAAAVSAGPASIATGRHQRERGGCQQSRVASIYLPAA